jgi:transposase
MLYVGMDISSKTFVVHAINERKKVILKTAIAPSRQELRRLVKELGTEQKLFVFEAGNQLKWVADTLKSQEGVSLHVVHPNEVKWITASSGKTDKVDAKKLAELARGDLLPRKVHLVEGQARQLRELLSARTQVMQKRVSLLNSLRGYLKQEGVQLGEGFFRRSGWQEQLMTKRLSETLKTILIVFRASIEALRGAELELNERIAEIENKETKLLETIPGIGVLSARTVVAALDNVKRFDNRKAVAKYGALTPTIYQSGDVVQLGRINRDGRHEVRRVLLQCAHQLARMKSPAAKPLREFYERLARRTGKKKALVALARKLLTVAYGVLKSGLPFDPAKLLPQAA